MKHEQQTNLTEYDELFSMGELIHSGFSENDGQTMMEEISDKYTYEYEYLNFTSPSFINEIEEMFADINSTLCLKITFHYPQYISKYQTDKL